MRFAFRRSLYDGPLVSTTVVQALEGAARAVKTAARALARPAKSEERWSRRAPYPICDDLASWVAKHGGDRWIIEPGFATSRPMPKTANGIVDPSFVPLCSYLVPERAVVRIAGARLRSVAASRSNQLGLVVLPGDEFVGELVALTPEGRRVVLANQPAYRTRLPRRPERKRGSFYAFVGFGMHHYYHWGHDIVMSARGIADRIPADTQLVVPAGMQPFQTEMLALLGLDAHPRVAFPPDAYWELDELYVVTPKLKTQIDSPEPYRWFREAVMARYGIREQKASRRLYLTRRHDGHWRTTNEPEVEARLARYGFETVAPGKLSFREQVELFGQAEAIVGTGAGLFNMAFSPPDTTVLQLQEPRHIVHALWAQAAAMGFGYYYVLGDSVPNPRGGDADIHVPLDELDATLAIMGVR
jgi:hypothetical protein